MQTLIIAADVDSIADLERLNANIHLPVSYKIGLELTTAVGVPAALEALARGPDIPEEKSVMLDLKLHDIPATMAKAIHASSKHGQVWGITMHASAGVRALADSFFAAWDCDIVPIVVSVLTSLSKEDCYRLYGLDAQQQIKKLLEEEVIEAMNQLPDHRNNPIGIVCAPQDLAYLKREFPIDDGYAHRFRYLTPGVRPTWAAANDQKRATTPKEAIDAGANHIIVGRPIVQPPGALTQHAAACRILEEIGAGP